MKLPNFLAPRAFAVLLLLYSYLYVSATVPNTSGFYIPDDIREVTFKYKTFKNLILLPVVINDTINVNLILDTGCRNLVLFGKRFQKLFECEAGKKVQFSGLGSGKPVYGALSLKNKVA